MVRRPAPQGTYLVRRRAVAAVAVVAAVLARASDAARAADLRPAEAVVPREKMGLDLSVGMGSTYGMIGLQARFDVPVRRWLVVAPFVANGLFFKDGAGVGAVPAGGVSLAVGRRFRLALDVGVGPIEFVTLRLHGTAVDARALLGPLAGLGLEVTRENGAYVRLCVGGGWPEWPPLEAARAVFVFNLGAGVRAL